MVLSGRIGQRVAPAGERRGSRRARDLQHSRVESKGAGVMSDPGLKSFVVNQPCPNCGAVGLHVQEKFAVTGPAHVAGFQMKMGANLVLAWSCAKCGACGRAHPQR